MTPVPSPDPRIPIVVGVTGHRDLRDEDVRHLEKKVRGIIREMRARHPYSPIVLLSPLAEGADRLVARVALELPDVTLAVPLPMPRAAYEADFQAEGSLEEFDRLLRRARWSFELPLVRGARAADLAPGSNAREDQYRQVGHYVARHSQVLIALWDGVSSERRVGTQWIVRFRLTGADDPLSARAFRLDPPDDGPVYHVVTPRVSAPVPRGVPFDLVETHPDAWGSRERARTAHAGLLHSVETLNEDLGRLRDGDEAALPRSAQGLVPEESAADLQPPCQVVRSHYAAVDALAIFFQGRWRRALKAILVLAAVGFVCLQAWLEYQLDWWALLGYPAAFGLAFLVLQAGRRAALAGKHLDYRALAEGLRLQFFWRVAGVDQRVPDHYLRSQRSELAWIRHALLATGIPLEESAPAAARDETRYRLALRHWIGGQIRYFRRALVRQRRHLRRFERWAERLLGTAFALAVVLVVLQASSHLPEQLRHLLAIGLNIALVTGTLFRFYVDRLLLHEQVRQYARMVELFRLARRQLRQALDRRDYDAAQEIMLKLGEEALAENASWLLMHRERPLDVPG